jgi:hypothetical protein
MMHELANPKNTVNVSECCHVRQCEHQNARFVVWSVNSGPPLSIGSCAVKEFVVLNYFYHQYV